MKRKLRMVSLACFLSLGAYADIEYNQQFVTKLPDNISSDKSQGGWSGGGGNVLVCFNKDVAQQAIKMINSDGSFPDELVSDERYIASVEMFDLFEAKINRGIEQPTPPVIIGIQAQETLNQYVEKIGTRFIPYVKAVDDIIKEGKKLIPDSSIRFYESAVVQNQDIGTPGFINKGKCVITTMAVQRSYNGFYELYVDSRLFNHPRHERLSKAIMLLHEYIYSFARTRQATDSLSTRKMVERIITKDSSYTVIQMAQMINDLKFNPHYWPDNRQLGHIFNASIVALPADFFVKLAIKLSHQITSYQPKNFSEEFKPYLKELELISNVPLSEDASFYKVCTWWFYRYNYMLNEPVPPIVIKFHNFLNDKLAIMEQDLKLTNQVELDKILTMIKNDPSSQKDRDIVSVTVEETYNLWMRQTRYYDYGRSEREEAMNSFLKQWVHTSTSIFALISEFWLEYYNRLYDLELSHLIP